MRSSAEIDAVFELVLRSLGSDESRKGYRSDWTKFTTWLGGERLPVLKVEARDVKRYVLHLVDEKKAKATRARALSVIREVYRALVDEGLCAVNPARETKNPRHGGTKRTPWFEEEALARLLAWRGDGSWRDRRDRICILLLAGIGWRASEIARVCVEGFHGGYYSGVVKRGKEETAPVPKWLAEELAAWREFAGIESGSVLLRSASDRVAVSDDIVRDIVTRVGLAVGIPKGQATPHAFRRTLATLADRRGTPLKHIQQQLGHDNLATTEKYLKGSRALEYAPGEWMGELVQVTSST